MDLSEKDLALVVILSRHHATNITAIFRLAVWNAEAKICCRHYLGFVLLEHCICAV